MAKSKQFVFKIDDDLGQALESAAKAFGESRAIVVCSALRLFFLLSGPQQRKAISDYLTRHLPPETGPAPADPLKTAAEILEKKPGSGRLRPPPKK